MMRKILSSLLILLMAFFFTGSKAQNKMSNIQHLDKKEQCLVNISALTAIGEVEKLKVQLGAGLDAGLTINEIKEMLVQLYAYCGFPRSLNGINALMLVLEERKAKGIIDTEGKVSSAISDTDKYQVGKKNLQTLTGLEETNLIGANAFSPAIDSFLKEHLFADIFCRDVLDFQQRELITIAALAAMTGVTPQLQAHIAMGMNTGLTENQLKEAFTLINKSVSKNQGDIARITLDKVLASKKQ